VKLHKRFLNQDWAQSAATWLVALYLRLVRGTGRWEVRGWEHIEKLGDDGTPALICFWHGRLITSLFMWPGGKDLYQLSTAHRDGKLAGKTYQRFGVTPVWLQSNSPMEATRKLVKLLKDGGFCSITPDGPRGPRQRLQRSPIDIARLAGAVLVPVSNSGNRMKILDTWDKMQFPLPFAHGALEFGAPIAVPRKGTDEELEQVRQHMEDTLNAMTRKLDQEFGQVTPEPAPLESAPEHAEGSQ